MPFKISGDLALKRLTEDCKFEEWRARRILNIAWEFGLKNEPCPGGYVEVKYYGRGQPPAKHHLYTIIEHIMSPEERARFAEQRGNKQRKRVAAGKTPRYTQSKDETPSRDTGKAEQKQRKGTTMPPKRTTRARQADPEPEAPANGEVDLQKYVTKDFSATMADYVTWMDDNVPGWDKMEVDRILVLGVQLYSHFQKSDFNIQRRAERKADRAQGGSEPEEDEAPATRTRTRKAPAKPAPAATGRSGARSGRSAGNGKAPAKPASRRTRASAGAASGGDAPF